MKKYIARPLTTEVEINQARNILFEVYYNEMNWRPDSDNASGLQIQIGPQGPMLVDDYDNTALWFGCFVDEKLVAVHRSHKATQEGFELDHYKSVPEQFKTSESVELTRLAIRKEYRTVSPVFIVLLAEEFKFLRAQGIRYTFGTANMSGPGKLYTKAGMKLHETSPFKYEENDPFEVAILYYDFQESTALDRLIVLSNRLSGFVPVEKVANQ